MREIKQKRCCRITKQQHIILFKHDIYRFLCCIQIGSNPLTFHGGNISAGIVFLGLDNANGCTFNKQSIVYKAGAGGEFTHRNAQSRKELAHILDNTSRLHQFIINDFSSFLLWCHIDHSSKRYAILTHN